VLAEVDEDARAGLGVEQPGEDVDDTLVEPGDGAFLAVLEAVPCRRSVVIGVVG